MDKTHVWLVFSQASGRIEWSVLHWQFGRKPLIHLKTLITISGPDGAWHTHLLHQLVLEIQFQTRCCQGWCHTPCEWWVKFYDWFVRYCLVLQGISGRIYVVPGTSVCMFINMNLLWLVAFAMEFCSKHQKWNAQWSKYSFKPVALTTEFCSKLKMEVYFEIITYTTFISDFSLLSSPSDCLWLEPTTKKGCLSSTKKYSKKLHKCSPWWPCSGHHSCLECSLLPSTFCHFGLLLHLLLLIWIGIQIVEFSPWDNVIDFILSSYHDVWAPVIMPYQTQFTGYYQLTWKESVIMVHP